MIERVVGILGYFGRYKAIDIPSGSAPAVDAGLHVRIAYISIAD
jgi:hypothetical protein